MYQHSKLNSDVNYFQKLKNLDFTLLFCILFIGFLSFITMYSPDGGEILFHTRSHFLKFIIFFTMMLVISFFNIRFWFSIGYIAYIIVAGMLIWTINFGVTASGSQR